MNQVWLSLSRDRKGEKGLTAATSPPPCCPPVPSEPPPLTLPLQLISSAQTTFLTCSEAAVHKAFGQRSSSNWSPESSSCPQQNLVSSTVASHIPEGKNSGQNSQWHRRRYLVCMSIFRVFLFISPCPTQNEAKQIPAVLLYHVKNGYF